MEDDFQFFQISKVGGSVRQNGPLERVMGDPLKVNTAHAD
jgi:hypothetical protein